MIPCFVISLPDNVERRQQMTNALSGIELPFEWVDAVDGRTFNVLDQPVYDSKNRMRWFGKHLTGGEIGCLLSHKKIYQKIITDNIEQALIFEDDVMLHKDFKRVLGKILEMDVDYDMIRFLGSPKLERLKMRAVYNIDGQHWLTRHTGMPGGAHATLICRSGVDKLLKYLDKTAFPIDALMGRCWETKLNWYTVRPGLASTDLNLDSTIGDERFKKATDLKGVDKLSYPVTRAWFKLQESIGKKSWYYTNIFRDHKLRKLSDG